MSALQSPILWLVVVILIVARVIIWMKGKDSSSWGFKEVVKNPSYWKTSARNNQSLREMSEAARQWDDETVSVITQQFVWESESGIDPRVMRSLGPRAHSTVLALLADKGLHAKLAKSSGDLVCDGSPLKRACDLLGDAPPAEVIDLIADFLDHPSVEAHKAAILVIGKTGDGNIVSPIRKALVDSDQYVRSYALMGLNYAVRRNGLAENVSQELFPDVAKLLLEGKNGDEAAEVLFQFDALKAGAFFLSPEMFHADAKVLHYALRTMAETRYPVPREDLLSLIASLESKELKYPRQYALGQALRLLGQHAKPEDRDFLLARTGRQSREVAEGSAVGLICSYGLEGYREKIWDTVEESGAASLNEHQRLVNEVAICDGEINNGGISQYFVNSGGDDWPKAVAGFEAMGSVERLAILREAIALFGEAGPSIDREKRQVQLSKIYRKNDEIFDEMESRYYKSPEHVEVLISKFVIANSESFR